MENEAQNRIVIDRKVMVGKPVIKGTRIPVDTIMRLLAQRMTEKDILEDYPNLTREDLAVIKKFNPNL